MKRQLSGWYLCWYCKKGGRFHYVKLFALSCTIILLHSIPHTHTEITVLSPPTAVKWLFIAVIKSKLAVLTQLEDVDFFLIDWVKNEEVGGPPQIVHKLECVLWRHFIRNYRGVIFCSDKCSVQTRKKWEAVHSSFSCLCSSNAQYLLQPSFELLTHLFV